MSCGPDTDPAKIFKRRKKKTINVNELTSVAFFSVTVYPVAFM